MKQDNPGLILPGVKGDPGLTLLSVKSLLYGYHMLVEQVNVMIYTCSYSAKTLYIHSNLP